MQETRDQYWGMMQDVRRNIFIAIANYLKLFTIAANITNSRYYMSARSAPDNSTLFHYTKAILTSPMSEFWQ